MLQSRHRTVSVTVSIMKTFCLSLLIVNFFVGCASVPDVSETDIRGTWMFSSVNGTPVPNEFYMKFEPNGVAQTWPSPHQGRFNTKDGVSTGKYRVENGFFVIVKEHTDDIKSRISLERNSFTLTTDRGDVLMYERVENPPQPGTLREDSGK